MSSSDPRKDSLQSLLNRQRSHWLEGQRIRPEDLTIDIADAATHSEVLLELIHHEVLLREESGELPTLQEYQQRYPDLADVLRIQWALDLAMMGEADDLNGDSSEPAVRRIGRYVLRELLGKGAMGIVYKAWDPELKRFVALKRLRAGIDATDQEKGRLRSEAEAIARIRHENIVQIYDLGQIADLPYFALEYCDAGNLATFLGGVPLAPNDAAFIAEQIARGVALSHQNQVIHRDLKPANVLLSRVETGSNGGPTRPANAGSRAAVRSLIPKVTDFGLARLQDSDLAQTRTGAIIGTPAYMAPEQVRGDRHQIGPAADVYALGAILYECLTGRPPFRAESAHETMRQVAELEPLAPMQLNPAIPADLNNVVVKCLEKDPQRRYPLMNDLAEDLRRFQQGVPVIARPISPIVRMTRWSRRHPIVAASCAIATLAIGVLIAVRENYLAELKTSRDLAINAQRDAERLQSLAESNAQLAKASEAEAITQKTEAERQLARAEQNSLWAMETVDALLQNVSDQALTSIPGMTRVRQQLLEEALRQSERFLADRGDQDPAAIFARGLALQRTGRIHRQNRKLPESDTELTEALELYRALCERFPDNSKYAVELGKTHYQFALTCSSLKGKTEGLHAKQESLKSWNNLLTRFPNHAELMKGKASTLVSIGPDYRAAGRVEEARQVYDEAAAIFSDLLERNPDEPQLLRNAAILFGNRAALLSTEGKGEEALASQMRARDMYRKMSDARPGDLSVAKLLSMSLMNTAAIRSSLSGQEQLAVESYRESLAIIDQLAKDEPLVVEFSESAADTWLGLGLAYHKMAEHPKALDAIDNAVKIRARLEQQKLSTEKGNFAFGRSLGFKALTLHLLSRDEEASPLINQTVETLRPFADIKNGPDFVADYLMAVSVWEQIHPTQPADTHPQPDALKLAEAAIGAFPAHQQLRVTFLALSQNQYFRYLSQGETEPCIQLASQCQSIASTDLLPIWVVRKALAKAHKGDHEAAIQEMASVRTFPLRSEFSPSEILAVYCLASQKAAEDSAMTEDLRAKRSQEYLQSAIEILREQITHGNYRIAANIEALETSPDLVRLREHPQYTEMTAQLKGARW